MYLSMWLQGIVQSYSKKRDSRLDFRWLSLDHISCDGGPRRMRLVVIAAAASPIIVSSHQLAYSQKKHPSWTLQPVVGGIHFSSINLIVGLCCLETSGMDHATHPSQDVPRYSSPACTRQ